ncbi:1,6-anhydro-N-acetylmuramyl-L-alanine amidase AmpD [compost metagenome]
MSCYQGRERCNDFSIGIELEGTDTLPYTDVQYQQLVAVTHTLMGLYPAIAQHITGHSDIAPQRKTDPGPAFDWQRFRTLFTALSDKEMT